MLKNLTKRFDCFPKHSYLCKTKEEKGVVKVPSLLGRKVSPFLFFKKSSLNQNIS
jgi:hypothetical protein